MEIIEDDWGNMVKVYCISCKYYRKDISGCDHRSNIKPFKHFESKRTVYCSDPMTLNKNNDCKNFEECHMFIICMSVFLLTITIAAIIACI